jgi:hypothetical protein
MLAKLGSAAPKFAQCYLSIRRLSDDLAEISDTAGDVRSVSKRINTAINKLDDIVEMVLANPPKGYGVADLLGKVPKIGIFIKMGLNNAQMMLGKIEEISAIVHKNAKRIDDAISVVDGFFKTTGRITGTTSRFLMKSHATLKEAHGFAQSTGFICGEAAGWMEEKNAEAFPLASKPLEAIATAGTICYQVLNPVHTGLAKLREKSNNLAKLMNPINVIVAKIEEFFRAMEKIINDFKKALTDTDAAKCAMSIFEPVTDLVNLATCPVSDGVGLFMKPIIDDTMGLIGRLVDQINNSGITRAVAAIVPGNLDVQVPNFAKLLPTESWFITAAVSQKYGEHAADVQTLNVSPLPYKITEKTIRDSILSKALSAMSLSRPNGGYKSACVEAWKSMNVDISACKRLLDQMKKVKCDAAREAHRVNQAAVSRANMELNRARSFFDKEKRNYDHAVNYLSNEQRKFDHAKNELHKARSGCPRCHCGSCCWYCFDCHAEVAWCCPAKGVCHAAISIASGTMDALKKTLDVAKGAVNTAKHTLSAAQLGLDAAKRTLRGYEIASQKTLKAMRDSCGRRRTSEALLDLEIAANTGY